MIWCLHFYKKKEGQQVDRPKQEERIQLLHLGWPLLLSQEHLVLFLSLLALKERRQLLIIIQKKKKKEREKKSIK